MMMSPYPKQRANASKGAQRRAKVRKCEQRGAKASKLVRETQHKILVIHCGWYFGCGRASLFFLKKYSNFTASKPSIRSW